MKLKKLISLLLCICLVTVILPVYTNVSAVEAKATVYVSSTGSDSNDGSENAPYLTLNKAFNCGKANELTIVLKDNISIPSDFVFSNGTAKTIVTAKSTGVTLDVSAKGAIAFYANVTFTGLKIKFKANTIMCANGKNLVIEDDVTFTNRINAYGGGYFASVASTNMTINGGIYNVIYAGSYEGSVTGNTVLNVGGNVNKGDNINDSSSSCSPCYIYGGCYNGTVGGSTTINYSGNAITKYITGSGYGTKGNTVTGTININISGGKVMNVYGGSRDAAVNTNVNVKMTGGLAEAVFGGSENGYVTGHVYMYFGGTADVSRRIYGGCYNYYDGWSFDTSYHVKGSTTVVIDTGCKIGSKTELSSGNQDNMGLFAGSRISSNQSAEVSTLVFLNNCYETYKSKIGDISGWDDDLKPHVDYTVKAASGGDIKNSTTAGTITLLPNSGKAAKIGSAYYKNGDTFKLTSSTTDVSFVDAPTLSFDLSSADTATKIDSIMVLDGKPVTVPSTDAVKQYCDFKGWTTVQNGKEVEYKAGDSITLTGDVTLYPVWEGQTFTYKVNHYYEQHHVSGYNLINVETLEGCAYEQTEAKAITMVGYKAKTITQKAISPDGTTVVSIYYDIDEDAKIKVGDVNADGTTDMLDAVYLQRCVAKWNGYRESKICIYAADCTKDGRLGADDVLKLLNILVGNTSLDFDGSIDDEENWGEWV